MKVKDRFFLLGLYLFNLGTVSMPRATSDFAFIAAVCGTIIGGLFICHSLEL